MPPLQQRGQASESNLGNEYLPSEITLAGVGTEADKAVNTVYSGMKLLENKYIDLANFYKELLINE